MASQPGPRHELSPLAANVPAVIVEQVTVEQVDSVDPANEESNENQEDDEEEEEEEEFVPRRSTRVRKPVILARPPPPPPKRKPKQASTKEKNEEESSSLSDEEGQKQKEQSVVKKRRKSTAGAKKSKAANKEESDAKEDKDDAMNEDGKENETVEKPKRKRKRVTEEAANEDQANKGEQGDEPPPKKKRPSKKAKAEGEANATAEEKSTVKGEGQQNGDTSAPKKRVKKPAPADSKEKDGDSKPADKVTKAVEGTTAPVDGDEETKKKRKRKPKEETNGVAPSQDGQPADSQATNGMQGEDGEPAKKKRSRKPKEPVVYVIPDVERKQTTFRGRLGYACINTVLGSQKPRIFTSRTCRLDTIEKEGIDFVKELGRQNIKDLIPILEWNEKNNIRFFRMSSDMFPFASHLTHGYTLEYCAEELKAAGDLAKKYGHRLTMHPGQYTQLGSPKENVIEASIRDLEYHAEIMDRMGLDQNSVMIIHMGGAYSDKTATMARFKKVYTTQLSDAVKRRLVLENDELSYNCDDLLTVCPQLGIPIVLDYHHHAINSSRRPLSELIPIINQTWQARGIKVKQHLSEARPDAVTAVERRAHADRVTTLPAEVPDDVDLMIEAKDKEQAVFELYRIYGLHEVIHENLRPPKENQGLRTEGRKSSGVKKPRKSQPEGVPIAPAQPEIIDPEMIDELADDDDL